MKHNFFKMLGIAILTTHLIQSPLQARLFNSDSTMPDTTIPMTVITAAGLYVGYNYLIRQDFLVEKKYPAAFAWYQAMQRKYPGLFDSIYFIQKPSGSLIPDTLNQFAQQCNWTRHNNRIYFDKNDLGTISLIYTKVIDGYPLHKKEQLILACYEFMLLHEAGHLAHQDAQTICAYIVGMFGLLYGSEIAYNYTTQPAATDQSQSTAPATQKSTEHQTPATTAPTDKNMFGGYQLPDLKDLIGEHGATVTTTMLDALGFPSKIPGILASAQGVTFVAGIIALLRHQEYTADTFACTHADTQTLQYALAMFEDDETDILYELETKTVMPYITPASAQEETVQQVAQVAEYTALYAAQQFYLLFKQTISTRWLFDFTQNALHHGPSIRAQMIHDELERRQK